MTHQPSFSQAEFATKKKMTRREKFLARMETLIPWKQLLGVIEPFHPKGQGLTALLTSRLSPGFHPLSARR
jgi:IS5 family transposase